MNANVVDMLRHGLTAGGAILVSDGLINSSQLTDLVGGLMVVISLGWQVYENHQQKPVLAAAPDQAKK